MSLVLEDVSLLRGYLNMGEGRQGSKVVTVPACIGHWVPWRASTACGVRPTVPYLSTGVPQYSKDKRVRFLAAHHRAACCMSMSRSRAHLSMNVFFLLFLLLYPSPYAQRGVINKGYSRQSGSTFSAT